MSTDFTQNDFNNGDLTDAEHIKRTFGPINNLESGAAFYRVAASSSNNYVVDFSISAIPGGEPGHYLTSPLSAGQVIIFKADQDSLANAQLQVTVEGGSVTAPLNVANTQVGLDDIKQDQIVVAIYNNTSTPRFDIVGVGGTGSGGGGAGALNDLSDVTLSSPMTGQILQHNGSGQFINVALSSAGIVITDVSGLQTALDAKQDDLTGTSDVPGLDTALAGKQATSERGQANGYAELDSGGKVPLSQLPSSGMGADELNDLTDVTLTSPASGEILQHNGSGQFVNVDLSSAGIAPASHSHVINDVTALQSALDAKQDDLTGTSDVPGLDTALAGKADATHTHDTSDITSGTLPVARGGTGGATASAARTSLDVPSTSDLTTGLAGKADSFHTHDASDIISGTIPVARGGTGGGTAAAARTSLDVPSNSDLTSGLAGKANVSHTHAASDITSGQVSITQGGTGADLSATGGTGQVLKQSSSGGNITVGPLSAGEMPSGIDASNISSGSVSNTEFDYLNGVTNPIQAQLDNKASTSHTHDASDITSGQLDLAQGGTGADLSATGGAGQVLKQSTSGGAVSVSALTAGDMPSGIDATKIGSGSVSNTEFGYLDGVTSNVQSQLNGKLSGSGSSNRLVLWSGSSSVTSDASLYRSGSAIYAGGYYSSSGAFASTTSTVELQSGYSVRARFLPGYSYVYSVRNTGGGQLMYWYNNELTFQYSRAAHKEDIKTLKTSIEDLMQWRAVEFKWKREFGGEDDIGLIAEEVAEVSPKSATYDQPWEYTDPVTGKNAKDDEGNPKRIPGPTVPAGVKYEKAWIPMLAALQDFYRKHQELEAEVKELKAKLGGDK